MYETHTFRTVINITFMSDPPDPLINSFTLLYTFTSFTMSIFKYNTRNDNQSYMPESSDG